jgi:hypothetical protein
MVSTVLRRVASRDPWAEAQNRLTNVLIGNDGGRIKLRGYDGIERDPTTGVQLSTGNYPLDIGSTTAQKFRIRNTADSGDVLSVTNTLLAITPDTQIGGTVLVTGAGTFSSTLGVAGDFAVNTNKFTVAASTGNTVVAGTLGATGAITGSSTITGTQLTATVATGTAPFIVNSTTQVASLNASQVVGKTPTATPAANALPLADGSGTLNSWITSGAGGGAFLLKAGDTASGLIQFDLGLHINGGTGAAGRIYSNSTTGMIVWPKAGSVNDLALLNGSGVPILQNPTTTTGAQFPGLITASLGVLIDGGTFAAGRIYSNTTSGTVIGCRAGSSTDFLLAASTAASVMDVKTSSTNVQFYGGLQIGAPAGGFKGVGTINAVGLYTGGTGPMAAPDWIFDLAYDGHMQPSDAERHPDTRLWSISETAVWTCEHRHLPSMPARATLEGAQSIEHKILATWETVERQALHIFELDRRLAALEG